MNCFQPPANRFLRCLREALLRPEEQASSVCQNILEETLRQGAQRLFARSVEREVEEYLQKHAQERDERGHRMVARNGSLPERTMVSVGHPEGNRAIGDRAKVVQTNDVFIFCPDHRNHAMLHEAIRRPVGEPGFRIGLHRFLTVFRKLVDGQITELAARKIQQARVAGLDGVDRRANAQETRMSPQERFVRGLARQFFKRKRFDGITRFAMGLPQDESRRGQPYVKRVR